MGSKIVNVDAGKLVCVLLEVHIWSGRRTLEKTDLIHANPEFGKLPEKELANLGSVKICDPDVIKQFQKLKNQAETVLKRAGLPCCGAIGVPEEKYEGVFNELTAIKGKYEALAKSFVSAYDQSIEDWKLKHLLIHPEWKQLFRDLPTAAHVGGRLSFDFHPYRISKPSDAEGDPLLNQHFNQQIGGLKGDLMREVASEATAFIESLNAPVNGVSQQREFVTPKTLGPLRRAAAKLDAFTFIDPEIGPLATLLSDLLLDMPDKGRIDGHKLLTLASVGRMMLDQKGIAALSSIAHNGGTASEVTTRVALPQTPGAEQTVPMSVPQPRQDQVETCEPSLANHLLSEQMTAGENSYLSNLL